VDEGTAVLIFGASARAAAFSALRAGLRPWCADLFGDTDLRARCPTVRLPGDVYPHGFLRLIDRELPGPWMYTGALENWPALVEELARQRTLWGNVGWALNRSRLPWLVADLLRRVGLPVPATCIGPEAVPAGERWLVKAQHGAGGTAIHFWDARRGKLPRRPFYFQEFVDGIPQAAIYVGDGSKARLLGATRQLVGEPWLHAAAFHYCGSLGPLPLVPGLRQALQRLGDVLAHGCGLRGLFGVDFIRRDGLPWPVEVNPRYTASVEVLEYAAGVQALAWHRRAFDTAAPEPGPAPPATGGGWLGKAILFARRALSFPEDGPWRAAVDLPAAPWEVPAFADVPAVGEPIGAGRPVLTFFARAATEAECLASLQRTAADLDSRLFGG
jgi:predicted ATP-grasp superfamily ATP-dependent carboligase